MPCTPSALLPRKVWHLMQARAPAPTSLRGCLDLFGRQLEVDFRPGQGGVGVIEHRHQDADVRVAEAGHAGLHVGPIVRAFVENALKIIGIHFGADAGERGGHAELIRLLHVLGGGEIRIEFLRHAADLVPLMAGIAIERRQYPGHRLGGGGLVGRLGRVLERRGEGGALGRAERIVRHPRLGSRGQAASGAHQLAKRCGLQARLGGFDQPELVAIGTTLRQKQHPPLGRQRRLHHDGRIILRDGSWV